MISSPMIQAFDPVFNQVDKMALDECGIHVLDNDESASMSVEQMTVFYMPHCEVCKTT